MDAFIFLIFTSILFGMAFSEQIDYIIDKYEPIGYYHWRYSIVDIGGVQWTALLG